MEMEFNSFYLILNELKNVTVDFIFSKRNKILTKNRQCLNS
jgi:hypothetical protein